MIQVDDLSRSLIAFEQISTLVSGSRSGESASPLCGGRPFLPKSGFPRRSPAMAGKLRTVQSSERDLTKPLRSSMCTRCITIKMAPVPLSSSREIKVFLNHSLVALRLTSE